ncbi:MAG1360 family OppF-related protein [Mycoplasma crocodyli]|uniref:ABC transporter ATP-binding protein n=1 Tax=Mycoplasma crocodyli (strain ATCC 51981 / MP145) TaxID=512564 RepID=D5E5X3_MYCCM|nr:hypothetical protein [Mycoplasma crocodyli]ADE19962.1 hypothetical protein MCRO_0547 [Mycoplasma crocodyli MP145]
MRISEKLFSVENFYKRIKSKKEVQNINIPLLELYSNQTTGILVDDKSMDFFFKHFWKNFSMNDHSSFSLYNKDFIQDDLNITFGREEVFKKVSFFDVAVLSETKSEIPLFEIWNSIKQNFENHTFNKGDFKNVNDNFSRSFKADIIKTLGSKSWFISEEYKNILESLNQLKNDIEKNSFTITEEEINKRIIKSYQNITNQAKKISMIFFEFYNEIYEKYKQCSKASQIDSTTILSAKIKHKRKQLNTLNKINETSALKVENDLKIRDIINEISFFEKYKKFFKTQSKKISSFILYKMKKSINTIEHKMSFFKSDEVEFLELRKELLVKKHSMNIFNHYKNKFFYLTSNQIKQIEKSFRREERLFLSNNKLDNRLSVHEINKKIRTTYEVNIFQYIQFSKEQKMHLKREINNRKEILLGLKSNKFDKIINHFRQVEEEKFKKEINMLRAEQEWNENKESYLLNQAQKNSSPRVRIMLRNVKSHLRNIKNVIKHIDKLVEKRFKNDPKSNVYDSLYKIWELIEQLNNFSLANSFLKKLFRYSDSSNFNYKENFETEFIGVIRFIEAFHSVSLDFEDYLTQYIYLEPIKKIKLKLVKFVFLNPSVLIVQDDPNIKTTNERRDFLKILNSLSRQYNFNYLFISNDAQLLTKYFDYVYLLYENNLVESGLTKDLLKTALHPYTKYVLNKISHNIMKSQLLFSKPFLPWSHADTFYLPEDRHYIFSTMKEFQNWSEFNLRYANNLLNTEEINYQENLHVTQTNLNDLDYIKKNYVPQRRVKEVFIANANKQKFAKTQEIDCSLLTSDSLTMQILTTEIELGDGKKEKIKHDSNVY